MVNIPGSVFMAIHEGVCIIRLVGDIRVLQGSSIEKAFKSAEQAAICGKNIIVDMSKCQGIDSTCLGVLAKQAININKKSDQKASVISTDPSITKLLVSMGLSSLFRLIDSITDKQTCIETEAIKPTSDIHENEVREMVLQAHKTLMQLNTSNKLEFVELVENLEREKRYRD